jgi:ribosomal protein L24E
MALQYASERLKSCRKPVSVAVSRNGNALQFACCDLRYDVDFFTQAASAKLHHDLVVCLMQHAVPALPSHLHVLKYLINKDSGNLQFASDDAKDDMQVVTMAVRLDARALRFASDRLRDILEFVTMAVQLDARVLQFASDRLRDMPELVTMAVQLDASALQFASERLRDEPDPGGVVDVAVTKSIDAFTFAGLQARSDAGFVLRVLANIMSTYEASTPSAQATARDKLIALRRTCNAVRTIRVVMNDVPEATTGHASFASLASKVKCLSTPDASRLLHKAGVANRIDPNYTFLARNLSHED